MNERARTHTQLQLTHLWCYFTLMYKTAVYTLLNGGSTHQKEQISKKEILRSMTMLVV